MILLELLWSFLQIGALSIGGGYAALPIIQNQVVELHSWLSVREFADILTISQMTPGPIAINAATFVGTKVAGLPGALIATFGTVLPSFVIVLTLAYIYYRYRQLDAIQAVLKGLRPAVVALIAAAGVTLVSGAFWPDGDIAVSNISWISVALFLLALVLLRTKKCGPIQAMFLCGVLAVGCSFLGIL